MRVPFFTHNHNAFVVRLFIATLFFTACGTVKEVDAQQAHSFVELPDDLSSVPDSLFAPLLDMLDGAKIIGITEGTHGMNEPLDFRNSFIKHLAEHDQIGAIAFESGVIESQMVNDYIHGKRDDLEFVLNHGISYTFGQFEQNRTLLLWLREFNKSRSDENTLQFYGFDMSGNAPNPVLENGSFALTNCLSYLETVDSAAYNSIGKPLVNYADYLHLKDAPTDSSLAYSELSHSDKLILHQTVEDLISALERNRELYIERAGESKYAWGKRAAICAKQNIQLLEQLTGSSFDYSVREKAMFDNFQWIQSREKAKPILLFAHLAHLAKDIYVLNAEEQNTMPHPQFGEYLHEHFGKDYKVIGNFYCYLDYYDGVDSVKPNSFPALLNERYSEAHFYVNVDKNDSLYQRPAIFGVPSSGGDVWMAPSKGVDVIFFTETQHFFYNEKH